MRPEQPGAPWAAAIGRRSGQDTGCRDGEEGSGRQGADFGAVNTGNGSASDSGRGAPGGAVLSQSSWEREANVIELPRLRRRLSQPIPVLTNRIAAALVHHEPGWRLPRFSVLARQYDVTADQVAGAVADLVNRGLIRHAQDGHYCRTSPAHYVLPFEGDGPRGLRAFAYPVGGDLCVKSRTVAEHPVRHDIEWALQLASDDPVWILQLAWTVDGTPGALTTTYLPPSLAESLMTELDSAGPDASTPVLPLTPLMTDARCDIAQPGWLVPGTLEACMQQPTRGAAQALGLSACQRAVMITSRYDDLRDGTPVALTVTALRPEKFRITIGSSDQPILADSAGLPSSGWSHVDGDWDF